MIVLLEAYYHNITKSCNEVGISTQTHYNWLAKFDDYKKECDQAKNGLIHRAEEILHSKFEDDTTALIFFLKCKGGYSEKVTETKQDKPLRIIVERLDES